MSQASGSPGVFIAIEGIDCAGKTTLAGSIAPWLESSGFDVQVVSRRSCIEFAEGYAASHLSALSRLIWGYSPSAQTSDLGFHHWAHLLAAWFHAVDETIIKPALGSGKILIADSWINKYVARFAVERGLPESAQFFDEVSLPDSVIWLDVPPEECAVRRPSIRSTERGEWHREMGDDPVESFVRYQSLVREQLGSLAASSGWFRVRDQDEAKHAVELVLR